MRIVDESLPLDGYEAHACSLVRPGLEPIDCLHPLQSEHVVRVYLNGELSMSLTCSPDHIVELVLGRLFTEGIIGGVGEVDEIRLCEHSTRVSVDLPGRPAMAAPGEHTVDDVSTCSTDKRTMSSLFLKNEKLPRVAPIAWSDDDIFALAAVFEGDTPMHKRTYGAHSCYLARGREVLYCCEDLGRHNALDKVIGCALVDGVELAKCALFTSGRIPTDMCVKAIRARIPLMISKAVPTDLAVQMAREHGLVLVCAAHSDSFMVM